MVVHYQEGGLYLEGGKHTQPERFLRQHSQMNIDLLFQPEYFPHVLQDGSIAMYSANLTYKLSGGTDSYSTY